MNEKTVLIPNISCEHCVATVEREAGELSGVTFVKAEEASKHATFKWDDTTTWDQISALLVDIEYPAEEIPA